MAIDFNKFKDQICDFRINLKQVANEYKNSNIELSSVSLMIETILEDYEKLIDEA